ncbi:MAG TPA: class I SAM-dependent methyltransferase [Polyangiaceae bacterium]
MTIRTSNAADDWDSHWRENAATNALNPAQVYRRDVILRILALGSAPAPVRMLDLGCGSGELDMHVLRERADAEILGLDMSETGIEMARTKVPTGHFHRQDFSRPLDLPGFDRWATHGVCTEVLEHLDDPTKMLANVRPLLATGAKLVITVPAGPMSAFDRHVGHRKHFTRRLLRTTIEDAGFEVVDLRGAGFPFFNLYRLAVVARGERLVEDASSGDESQLPLAARAAIRTFGVLFKLSTDRTPFGWQLVAVASPR